MRSLRRACLCLLLRIAIADDLDEEDLFDLDGEGDYEDPESYIEYDQALYYDGPDDYYDGIEQFNLEDMADYPGEVSPELLEKIFGENPGSQRGKRGDLCGPNRAGWNGGGISPFATLW